MYIELKNINKTFGNFKTSDNVSFGIEKGKLIGLLGPSGSGKTTILRIIAGLEKQDSGDIIIRRSKPHFAHGQQQRAQGLFPRAAVQSRYA